MSKYPTGYYYLNQIEASLRLKGVVQLNDERVIDGDENVTLGLGVTHVGLARHDGHFVDRLHREDLPGIRPADLPDLWSMEQCILDTNAGKTTGLRIWVK
jgi:hypothetical protein